MSHQNLTDLLRESLQPRTARLFTNGRNQALRLPRELEFKGVDEVSIYRVGSRLVIEPKRKSFLDLVNLPAVDDDYMAERPKLRSEDGRVKF